MPAPPKPLKTTAIMSCKRWPQMVPQKPQRKLWKNPKAQNALHRPEHVTSDTIPHRGSDEKGQWESNRLAKLVLDQISAERSLNHPHISRKGDLHRGMLSH